MRLCFSPLDVGCSFCRNKSWFYTSGETAGLCPSGCVKSTLTKDGKVQHCLGEPRRQDIPAKARRWRRFIGQHNSKGCKSFAHTHCTCKACAGSLCSFQTVRSNSRQRCWCAGAFSAWHVYSPDLKSQLETKTPEGVLAERHCAVCYYLQ